MSEGIFQGSRIFRDVAVVWIVGWAASSVLALQINVAYMEIPGQPPHTDDPGGTRLTDAVEAAAQHYMDIIGDTHTLNLTISWADLSDASGSGVLGVSGIANQTGHISSASISFDTKFNGADRSWYFDNSPFDDGEFLMTQVLYGQLPELKKTDGYNGAAPDPFEVGYFGNATDPAALGKVDLLTTALHEIAHTLGYTAALDTTAAETADGDYDTQPNLLRGTSVGIRAAPGDVAHLAVDQSVVCGDGSCVGAQFVGRRIRPSASDLFGIAKVNNFTTIDLQRQDFIGGSEWHVAANWEGNTVPDSDDIVGVRHDGFVVITDGTATASTLIVGNDSHLIADDPISVANSITIESNSSLTIAVGGFTNFTILRSGSSLEVNSGTFFSSFVTAENGSVTIDGATLDSSFPTVEHGTLEVINGGIIDSSIVTIGDGFGTNQATATVDGFSSLWNNTSTLTVGGSAQGTLEIFNGGSVSDTQGTIGRSDGRQGTVTVSGPNSTWTNSAELFIGDEGEGTLNIEDGGDVTNTQGFIANQDGSSGDVTVTGSGSTWTNSEFIVVGFFGDGSLSVLDGGQVLNPTGSASIGNRSDSTGTVLVDGPGSSWTNDFTFFVGFEGSGEMTIQNGGSVSNTGSETTIALMEGSEGTVLVDGPGSSWMNDVFFSIGAGGTAELTIQNGGSVSNTGSQTIIGGSTESNGTVTVDGANSEFDVTATPLVVGVLGTGELIVRNGATANNAEATVGDAPLSRGTVTVEGDGSTWTSSGDLTLGDQGIGDLNILDGGLVMNRFANLSTAGGVGRATVSGAGSTWNNEFDLVVGAQFNTGFMTISDGGTVNSNLSVIGFTSTARGVVEVTDPGSTWTNTSSLSVGQEGEGELTIANGGSVSNTFGFIGFLGGQATVTVDGDGSSWTSSENVFIGANGALNIQNGGCVDSEKTMFIDGGTVTLEGGHLMSNGITLNSGSFNFTGGRLSVETFQGVLIQDGGTLVIGNSPGVTTVTNQYTFNAGMLAIELAGSGSVAGTDFDQLVVNNTATLVGNLAIDLLAGFTPGSVDSFTVLSAGTLTGAFNNVANGARLGTLGGEGSFLVSYDGVTNAVVLSNFMAGLAGDYNGDAVVDAADYTVWRDNLGAPAGTLPNDIDGGVIGQAQYNTWVANFGNTTNFGSGSLSNVAVPEPASAMLLLMMTAAGTCLRCRCSLRVPKIISTCDCSNNDGLRHVDRGIRCLAV